MKRETPSVQVSYGHNVQIAQKNSKWNTEEFCIEVVHGVGFKATHMQLTSTTELVKHK
jgi:hypothetical protein